MTGKNYLKLLETVGIVLCCTFIFIGCNNPKTIKDYPGSEFATEIVSEEEEETVTDEKEKDIYIADEEEELEDIMPNDYPFDGTGNFIYNPVALRPGLSKLYHDKPEYLEMAKQVMLAVNDGEKVLTLEAGYPITKEDFDEVLKIAETSNPVVYIAKFETEDYYNFTITYPDYFGSFDEYESYRPDNLIKDDKNFPAEMDEFRDFVTDVIDSNVNYQDNDMENARKIYKYLIENLYIKDNDWNYSEPNPDATDGRSLLHIDVVRNLKNDRLYLHEFIMLYQYMLTQLNIENQFVTMDGKPAMDRYLKWFPDQVFMSNVHCLIIRHDGMDYLCNPYFEYLDFKNFPLYENDTECHCTYFAISKQTNNKYFKINAVMFNLEFERMELFFFGDLDADYPFDDREFK